ncbi:TonB family protein [Devosia sp.]|uniref:energy transducer TonB family protein n=1 Tax=Devosia sp. TaxID=1871048 RepID=UPI00326363BE
MVGKLRRALRFPRGTGNSSGEVQVQFVVSSAGQPSGMRIVQSSDNAPIDQAGLDTVVRAAPFPPIPQGANRSEWAFTVPLAFTR